ncbi:MAG: hypothetical protein IIB33_04640 [Chloroflexi bacterium]|nr:hypothetical protein [Chloroflexota bacterium]
MASKLDPDTARHIAEATIENIRHVPSGLIPRKIVPKAAALKSRELAIPDVLIEEFLEHDIEMVSHHYVRTMAPELELVERFGRKDLADQLDEISAEYAVLVEQLSVGGNYPVRSLTYPFGAPNRVCHTVAC